MSITILDTDMFASGADSLVCPVNCVGTMGAGLAKVFSKRYPQASRAYQIQCKVRMFPGEVGVVLSGSSERLPKPGPLIYFAATKLHWRDPSKLEWVRACAEALVKRALANAVTHTSIAIPALGCGCGEIQWDTARHILVESAERIESAGVKVYLYGPDAGPKGRAK